LNPPGAAAALDLKVQGQSVAVFCTVWVPVHLKWRPM